MNRSAAVCRAPAAAGQACCDWSSTQPRSDTSGSWAVSRSERNTKLSMRNNFPAALRYTGESHEKHLSPESRCTAARGGGRQAGDEEPKRSDAPVPEAAFPICSIPCGGNGRGNRDLCRLGDGTNHQRRLRRRFESLRQDLRRVVGRLVAMELLFAHHQSSHPGHGAHQHGAKRSGMVFRRNVRTVGQSNQSPLGNSSRRHGAVHWHNGVLG